MKRGRKRADLTGQRFGKWTVERPATEEEMRFRSKGFFWFCRCDCGRTGFVTTGNLRGGQSTRCMSCAGRAVDLSGQRFGRWAVLRRALPEEFRRYGSGAFWVCRCDCGNVGTISGRTLRTGGSRSCGCYRDEVAAQNGRRGAEIKKRMKEEQKTHAQP